MLRPVQTLLCLALLTFAIGAFARTEVVPGVQVIRGTFQPGSQPDGNSVIIDAPDGLVVIDTGRHVAHTQQILDLAKARKRPIAAVVNTHWHLDHIGGNALVRRDHPGVRIHASGALDAALTGFLASYRQQLQEMLNDPKVAREQRRRFETEVRLIDSGSKLAPDAVIERGGERTIAGRTLIVGLESNAVTAGDVWVLDPVSGVLIAGDLVTLPAPFLDTACPRRWRESLERLGKVAFDVLIPGHGSPMTRTQFGSYQRAFTALLDCASKGSSETECTDGWIRDVRPLMPDLDEKFTRSLMAYYVGVLRGDPAKTSKLCGD